MRPELGLSRTALIEAQRRLKREHHRDLSEATHATLLSRTQAVLDRADADARAVGTLDVLVLLPSGRVARVSHRAQGLLPALYREGPRDRGIRGAARRDGDWLRFSTPFGWTATGMIVDRVT